MSGRTAGRRILSSHLPKTSPSHHPAGAHQAALDLHEACARLFTHGASISESRHLGTDGGEVVEIDDRLARQPWINPCGLFVGAVEKSHHHLVMSRVFLDLDDIAEGTSLLGQVTEISQQEQGRSDRGPDGGTRVV